MSTLKGLITELQNFNSLLFKNCYVMETKILHFHFGGQKNYCLSNRVFGYIFVTNLLSGEHGYPFLLYYVFQLNCLYKFCQLISYLNNNWNSF